MLQTPLMSTSASRTEETFIPGDEAIPPQSDSSEALRQRGLIRASGIIPIKLNERIKAMARKQGRNADQLIGELIESASHIVDQHDATEHAAHLKELLGPNWLQILQEADQTEGNP